MEWIASEIGSLLLGTGASSLKGLCGRFKLYRIKKKLDKNIFSKIKKQYGYRAFYNDLDSFLATNKVITNLLENCELTPHTVYRSKSALVDYYVQMFIERFPRHFHYRSEIIGLLKNCFNVIYTTLNDISGDENARVICNLSKELAGELSLTLDEIKYEVKKMSGKMEFLIKQNEKEIDEPMILFEPYLEAQTRLYLDRIGIRLIPRTIYYNTEDSKSVDTLDALLKDKHILLLGDAGYGKTFEAIDLLIKACKSPKTKDLIPVYLPLYEYGTLYESIFEGINYKLTPFCNGNPENKIKTWLFSGQLILILDGIDDIQTQEKRNKFFAEAKNYMINYEKSFIFITSRNNRYNDELGNIKKYRLTALSQETIRKQLHEEGIYIKIPDSYYWLFSNPMFLNVGITVLKQNKNNEIFNRSILFEKLMDMLCGEWDKKKGVLTEYIYNYNDILNILGNYAFETFKLPSFSLQEFDQFIGKLTNNKAQITNAIIRSGILKVKNDISFTHKLFKEYCAAYYIVKNYPLPKNISIYAQLIHDEDWKEVCIFISGMFKTISEQDDYLDYIMEHNLMLYVECVNAKSDLSTLLPHYNSDGYSDRYLRMILKTYTFIVNKYFAPLKDCFDPKPGKARENVAAKKIRIVGCVSNKGEHLYYWFDRVTPDESEVLCLYEDQIVDYHSQYKSQAIMESKNIQSHFVNLRLSGLGGDSCRKIAIDRIKSEVEAILKKSNSLRASIC